MKLADTAAIAIMVKRPEPTIRYWAHTGQLTRHGTDTHGRALYSVDEAEQLAHAKLDNTADMGKHQSGLTGSMP
jgi:hypothetical protein